MPIHTLTQATRRIFLSRVFLGVFLVVATPILMFPTQFGGVVLFILTLMLGVIGVHWWPTSKQRISTPFDGVLLVFLMMVGVGVLASSDLDLTLPKLTNLILGVVLLRVLAQMMVTHRLVVGGFVGFVLVGLGIIGVGVFSANWQVEIPFVAQVASFLPPQLLLLPESGAGGVHLNQLAAVLALVLPVLVAVVLARGYGWRWRAPAGILTFFLVGLLLLTQSRSAWLGSLAGLGCLLSLWFIVRPRRLHRHPTFIVIVILFVIASLLGAWQLREVDFVALWQAPPEMTQFGTFSTISSRLVIWRWGGDGVLDFPWTGVGLGAFRQVVMRLYPLGVMNLDIAHAHNIFLQIALDIGLPGLVAYLALLGLAVKMAWQVARCDVMLRPLALGALAGLVALHGFGLLDALTLGSRPGILFWLLLGLIAGMDKLVRTNPPTT